MSMERKGSYNVVTNNGVPVDRFCMIYLIVGLLGIGTILPMNMFITVSAYWDYKWETIECGILSDANVTLCSRLTN